MPFERKRRARRISPGTYALLLAIFATLIGISHAPFFDLPFFWDEVGQFVPAALDLHRSASLVPRSVAPNAHPPGVMAYLAGIWSIAGFSIVSTRCAMLLLASVAVLIVFLLAIKLCGGVRGVPAFAVVALLMASPIFYAQAMLAQLDMPSMLFTALATLLFLEERIFFSAVACVALVLVKETGAVAPLLFGLWLLVERRTLQAGYFLLPLAALGSWFLLLYLRTGHIFGSAEFTKYNLAYMAHPVRAAVALARRLYHLFGESPHWIGAIGILYAWNRGGVYGSRDWRVAWTLLALNIVLFSIAGGAMLERYLLPALPIVYIGMIAGWSVAPAPWRAAGPVALIAGAAVANFWNPPYPFPLENNLAFTEMVRLHQTAAGYIEEHYPGAEVTTAWPFSAALSRPEFGYVKAAFRVREIGDFGQTALGALERTPVDLFVLYSRQWDPPGNLLRHAVLMNMWRRFFPYEEQISPLELDTRLHLKVVAAWMHAGQWIEVHARSEPRP